MWWIGYVGARNSNIFLLTAATLHARFFVHPTPYSASLSSSGSSGSRAACFYLCPRCISRRGGRQEFFGNTSRRRRSPCRRAERPAVQRSGFKRSGPARRGINQRTLYGISSTFVICNCRPKIPTVPHESMTIIGMKFAPAAELQSAWCVASRPPWSRKSWRWSR